MAEIIFKVNDSGSYRDGDVLDVKPDGWHIPPAEIIAWVQDGVVPPSVDGMPSYLRRRLARRVAEIKWKLTHTAAEIEAEWNLPEGSGVLEKSIAQADRAKLLDVGLDTNWGFDDLKHHGVVRVDDVSVHEIVEFLDRDQAVDHVGYVQAKRRWRLRYWDHLSAAKVTAWRDKLLHVDVDRVLPVLKSSLTDEPRGD